MWCLPSDAHLPPPPLRPCYALAACREPSQRQLVADVRTVRPVLDRLGRSGFLNLRWEVVFAFQAAGLTWGGAWTDKKDYMHFEIGALGP